MSLRPLPLGTSMDGSSQQSIMKVQTLQIVDDRGPSVDISPVEPTSNDDEKLLTMKEQKPVRGASALLQLKLMMWKHMLSKRRDLTQIGASLIVPLSVFMMMWLFRRKPYQLNADPFFINIALLLQPLAQVASLVAEKQKGLKSLMTTCGLSPAIYNLSWFLSESLAAFALSLILSLFALSTEILHVNGAVSFFMLWILIFVYLCASAAMAFALSSLFSKPSTAAPATFVIYLGLVFVFLILGFQTDRKNRALGCTDLYPTVVTPQDVFGDGGDDDDSYGSYSYGFVPPSDCRQLVRDYNYTNSTICGRPGICMLTCDVCKKKDYTNIDGWTEQQQVMFSFVPTFALTFAVIGFEQGVPPLSYGTVLGMLCLDVLIYMFGGWYLSEVFPGEGGTPRKPWFVLEPNFWRGLCSFHLDCFSGLECQLCNCCNWFWCFCCRLCDAPKRSVKQSQDEIELSTQTGDQVTLQQPVEDIVGPEEVVEAVKISGLRKEFGSHVAVEGLDLTLYQGEIFALLGHNGAGKTTTVSMLTGLLERTDGDATIYGHSLSSGIDTIRQLLGVCPQHDVLFDYLTIGEHIDLFARLKGATLQEMVREREAMLTAFELKQREDFFPVGLSGGMKRKACVALALTGDTRLCILDEPTTGLDPGARRRLWDTLAMLKKGRTIMLSTHFMDEAEVLGDRVGIMKDGKLACVGSPVELKQQFDIGYELLVRHSGKLSVKDSVDDTEADAMYEANNPMVAQNKATESADNELLASKMSMEIASFILKGIQGATQKPNHPVPNELRFSLPLASRSSFGPFLGQLEESSAELGIVNFGISMEPFEEVFLKVGNESTVLKSTNQTHRRRSSRFQGDTAEVCIDGEDGEGEEGEASGEASGGLLPSDEFYRNVGENIRYVPTFYGQTKAIFIRRLELAVVALGLDWNLLGLVKPPRYKTGNLTVDDDTVDIQANTFFKLDRYPTLSDLLKLPQLLRGVQTWLLILIPLATAIAALYFRMETKTFYFLISRTGDSPSEIEAIFPNILVCVMIVGGYIFVPGLLAELLVAEREAKVRNLLAIMGVEPAAYWLGHALGDLALLSVPMFGTWICLPIYGLHLFADASNGLFFLLHILFVLELLAFTYCLSHAFSSTAFAMALLPAISLALLVLPILIMLFTAQFDSMLNDDDEDALGLRELLAILMGTWALLGPHGFFLASSILLTFPHKYANDHTDRYIRLFSEDFTPLWAMCLASVIKTCSYGYTAYYLDFKHLMPLPPPPDPFKDPTEEELASLDSDVADEFRLVNQHRSLNDQTFQLKDTSIEGEEGEEIETGVGEDEEVHAIEYHRLRKVYPNSGVKSGVTVAVRDSNFHVVQGECFGLLGPNGAGKSTTISMMTRHTPSTRGDVFVMGQSVRTDFTSAARCMGVVTQDNSLYGELDSVAHLELFARVRGVPESDIPALVHDSLSLMELHPHCRKPSKRLSGGMKRKLCTALSLIGNPAVVVYLCYSLCVPLYTLNLCISLYKVAMDEPSSGLDPSSRRNLWKVINETMKKRAVVLTTHLLDEAEALCGRIGIMTHGTMQCIGSALHLRKKFGKGYQVVLTTKEMGAGAARDLTFVKVNKFVQTLFKDKAELINRHSRMLTYRVPAEYIQISKAFSDLEANMKELNLDSYVICQPTLEQVFLGFTVEKDREHSHLTNEAESTLASAFDDTDVRIANASKSKCCWMERPQHKKNFYRSCLLIPVPILAVMFGFDNITNWLFRLVEGEKSQVYNTPRSERTQKFRCDGFNNSLPTELTHSYQETFTHYAIFNSTEQVDVCNGIQLPFTLNPNWNINNFSISVGVSGDLDARNGATAWADEWWWPEDSFHSNTWDETAKVYLKSGVGDTNMKKTVYDDYSNYNWNYENGSWFSETIDDFDTEGEFGVYLGECGGCPVQWGRANGWDAWELRHYNWLDNCGGYNSTNKFTRLEGRCQMDCDNEPFYETCIPETYGGKDQYGWWGEFSNSAHPNKQADKSWPFQNQEAVNNFTVTIRVDEGVNIKSCKSGLSFKVNIGLGYECSGGVDLCSKNNSLGYDYSSDQMTSYMNATQCEDRKHYRLEYVNPYVQIAVFISFQLTLFILCCTCIGACCGMCCTKTPEDDSESDFQSKKKSNWSLFNSKKVNTQDPPALEPVEEEAVL